MSRPWYKQPWLWLVIAIPASSVAFGVLMVVVAGQNPDDLVADDYYKEGLAINEQLARDKNAGRRDIEARLLGTGGGVRFRLTNVTDSAVVLNMHHVVDRERDRRIVLYPEDEPGVYAVDDKALAQTFTTQGIWYLEFEGVDDPWRLQGRVEMPLTALRIESRWPSQ